MRASESVRRCASACESVFPAGSGSPQQSKQWQWLSAVDAVFPPRMPCGYAMQIRPRLYPLTTSAWLLTSLFWRRSSALAAEDRAPACFGAFLAPSDSCAFGTAAKLFERDANSVRDMACTPESFLLDPAFAPSPAASPP